MLNFKALTLAFLCVLGFALLSLRVNTHLQRPNKVKPLPLYSTVLDHVIRSEEIAESEKREKIKALLRRRPLSSKPYLYTGLLERSEVRSAINLLLHAQKLNARDRLVSGYLIETYFAANDFDNVIAQIDLLCRLDPRIQAKYTSLLADITVIPQVFEKINDNISSESCWQKSYMLNISNEKKLATHADKLIRQSIGADKRTNWMRR